MKKAFIKKTFFTGFWGNVRFLHPETDYEVNPEMAETLIFRDFAFHGKIPQSEETEFLRSFRETGHARHEDPDYHYSVELDRIDNRICFGGWCEYNWSAEYEIISLEQSDIVYLPVLFTRCYSENDLQPMMAGSTAVKTLEEAKRILAGMQLNPIHSSYKEILVCSERELMTDPWYLQEIQRLQRTA